jgi:MFS transporter, DHA1 family, multidrug resistance protein
MHIYLVALLLSVLAGTEVDLFIPSFPEIQAVFGLTPFLVELALGVNLVAYCVTCLMAGNFGDRYGHRLVILVSLLIFVIGSFLCCVATEFWHLLLGRGLQGMGIAAPSTLAYVIIADHYSLEQQQKLLGVLNGTVTLAMTFAPIIGSYISLYFHWQGNFIFLLVLGFLSLVLCYFWIPASKPNLIVRLSIKEYFPIFTSLTPFLYVSIISLLVAAYWIFIGIAPILYMESLDVSLAHFGLYQGSLALAFSIMSFSSGYWIRKFGQKACFYFGIKMLCLFCLGALGIAILDIREPKIITGVLLFSSIGALFPINLLYPFMLESISNAKGRISSVQVGGRLLIAALCIQLVSYFYAGSFRPLGITMVIIYLLALWLGVKLFRRVKVFE